MKKRSSLLAAALTVAFAVTLLPGTASAGANIQHRPAHQGTHGKFQKQQRDVPAPIPGLLALAAAAGGGALIRRKYKKNNND
jgi:hypothetical protein